MSDPSIDEITITPSSGNVFEDLGLPNAQERLARAQAAALIASIIKDRRLTQVEAARILGIDQPKVSALVRGRLSGFTLERLFHYLNALDFDVEVKVCKKPENQRHAVLTVEACVVA